jgi:hypothetical protein
MGKTDRVTTLCNLRLVGEKVAGKFWSLRATVPFLVVRTLVDLESPTIGERHSTGFCQELWGVATINVESILILPPKPRSHPTLNS